MKNSFAGIRVNSCGYHVCVPAWRWDGRNFPFPDYDLWVVFAGRGWLELGGERHPLHPGAAVLFCPGDRHLATHDPAQTLVVRAAHFDYLNAQGKTIHPGEQTTGARVQTLRNTEFVAELMDRMLGAFYEGEDRESAGFWLEAALRERAADRLQRQHPENLRMEQCEEIQAICREIRAHPEKPWRVKELAKRLHCTPDHFTRSFRVLKNCTPRAFLLQTRMEAARDYLRNSSLGIGQIAALLGYCDVYLFSRQFKHATGICPGQYRRYR